jgi:hypothetical protein
MRLELEYQTQDADELDAAYHPADDLVHLSVLSADGEVELILWLTPAQARALGEKLGQAIPPGGE